MNVYAAQVIPAVAVAKKTSRRQNAGAEAISTRFARPCRQDVDQGLVTVPFCSVISSHYRPYT